MQLLKTLENHLKEIPEYVSENGDLKKWVIINKAQNLDEDLIGLLLDKKELKSKFFLKVKDALVFNQSLFIQFLEQKNYLNDSYTSYKKKIGLNIDGKYLNQRNEVSLVWPYKDCVLEGGQSREEDKREEIFFNETLAQDEITQLFEPKVLTNAKRYTSKGEKPLDKLSRDAELNRKRGLPEDTITDNLIIKGNNLLALHSLKEEFAGKVKLIYIDPPYNTGNDSFKYNDNFNHSTWLTFMKNRLEIGCKLLRSDGCIWINADDSECQYLKVLCDDIFGRENFLNTIVWQRAYSPVSLNKYFSSNTDFICCYAKNYKEFELNKLHRTKEQNDRYKNPDNDIKGDWKPTDFSVGPAVEKNIYEISLPSGRKVLPPKGRSWLVNKDKLKEFIKENKIWFGGKGDAVPSLKKYKSEVSQGITPMTLWTYQDVGHNQDAKKEMKEFGFDNLFGTPKPEGLIQRIINIGSKEEDIILDFFAGSGTTAAVALKMKRQFIVVEQMDYIEDVTIERMKKVIGGEQGGISESVNWKGGGEFVYFELKKFNEAFIEKIEAAKDTKALLKIWEEMKQRSFLNYNVNIKKQDESIEEFKKLSLKEQKKLLVELLDKNQLYVNLSSMEDRDFKVTEEEKKITKDFYGMKK